MPTPKQKKNTKHGPPSKPASVTNDDASTKVPSVDSSCATQNSLSVSPRFVNKRSAFEVVKGGETRRSRCGKAKQSGFLVHETQGGSVSRKRRSDSQSSSQNVDVLSPSGSPSLKNYPSGTKRKSAFEMVKQSPGVRQTDRLAGAIKSVVDSDSSTKVVKKAVRKASGGIERGRKSNGKQSAFHVKVSEPLDIEVVQTESCEADSASDLLSDESHHEASSELNSPSTVRGRKKSVRSRRSKVFSSGDGRDVRVSPDYIKDSGEEVEVRGDIEYKAVAGHCDESSEMAVDEGAEVVPELVQMNSLSESCRVFRITSDQDTVQEVVMVLDHPLEFCIRGRVSLQALHGCVSVHGHFIPAGDKFYNIFSPTCSSSLTICTATSQNKDKNIKSLLKSHLGDAYGSLIKHISELLKPGSVVLRLRELQSKTCDYLTSGSLYQNLFNVKDDLSYEMPELNSNLSPVGLTVHKLTSCHGVHISDGVHQVAEQLIKDVTEGRVPVVVVCGGKNSGKSTLVRFLVNSLLNFTSSVGVLDCDPGQTEFTVPGCVSFTTVQEPLLGPPFTHMTTCSRTAFTGALSPASDPQYYVACLQYVYKDYSERVPHIPLVVNTMGWNQGLGLVFMSDTLRLVRPSLVVQLDSASRNRNFPPLTSGFVCRTLGLLDRTQLTEEDSEHDLLIIDSPNDFNKQKLDHFGAVDFRNLAIQAYFAPVLTSGVMFLNAVKPYVVPWSAVAVHVCHVTVPRDQMMLCLSGTVVALCNIDSALVIKPSDPSLPSFLSEKPVCSAIGFGLVRAIDPWLKVFYVVTPVAPADLRSVNCFLKGSLEYPEHLLKSQDIASCTHLPYIDRVPDGFGGIKQKQYLQRRRYGGQSLLD